MTRITNIDYDYVLEVTQRCFHQFPTIILGSGASAEYGISGMKLLRKYILNEMKKIDQSDDIYEHMKILENFIREDNLEEALKNAPDIEEEALKKIREWTWSCINMDDLKLINTAISKCIDYDVGDLILRMFESNHHDAHIITTNYDRAVEYACLQKGLYFETGFLQDHLQTVRGMGDFNKQNQSQSRQIVNIHKVHGSLDWFKKGNDGELVCVLASESLPKGLDPLIVTPGRTKFQRTHENPFRTAIRKSDQAIDMSSSFLCVGFGFNDEHIQPRITKVCTDRNIPVVILSKDLTSNTKKFLKENAGKNYIGIERVDDNRSRVYVYEEKGKYKTKVISRSNLWSMCGFCKMVL